MIEFQRIRTSDVERYTYMEQLLVASFPPEEYRSLEELRAYTDSQTHFSNNIILCNGVAVGLITYWNLGSFYYVEHFAIDPQQRNGGHGQNVLSHLCRLLDKPIVLEVELPENDLAQRRINFYRRHGFALWEKPYLQPPYKAGDNFLPMYIMAYGNIECEENFERIRCNIYKEVYGVEQGV